MLRVFECAEFVSTFQARVEDPLGRPIKVPFGFLRDGKTAIIEMACALGLRWLRPEERGVGMAQALGTRLFDKEGRDLPPCDGGAR